MASIEALILAAGRGSRLGKRNLEAPKCLLEIGRRRLIDHQLEALADAGIGPVRMVVGYCANEVREIVGIRAEYIHNTRWESTNSLYSWWLARDAVKRPVIILNADVLFAPRVLERLLDAPGDALAVDSSSGTGREQMKVKVEDGLLRDMSKSLPPNQTFGENLGIIKLTESSARRLFEIADEQLKHRGKDQWLGSAMRLLARERDIHVVDVAGVPWVEIDFPVDLDRARRDVWPAIESGKWQRNRLVPYAGWGLAAILLVLFATLGVFYSGSTPVGSPDWESVPLPNLESTTVTLEDERLQNWWVLDRGETAIARISGPSPVRIESRLLDRPGDEEPYVLEVSIDGELADYLKETTRPSGKATHERWAVSHKERSTIEVPAGSHRVDVRLIAPPDASCLIRIRQVAPDTDD